MSLAEELRQSLYVLDESLRNLVSLEGSGSVLPLSVRRFAETLHTPQATRAIRLATDGLLAKYLARFSEPSLPISVEQLCELCGVQLKGARPLGRAGRAYSIHSNVLRKGHTGKTYFGQPQPIITIPAHVDFATARLSVAHELGHILVHSREVGYDEATTRLPSSMEEEGLAEYAARLLLMPISLLSQQGSSNLAEASITRSSAAHVTVHSSVVRLGDPDMRHVGVRGAILWRLNPQTPRDAPLHQRLTPQWHLCPRAFVPIKRSWARCGSLTANLAAESAPVADSKFEEVSIGTFVGSFTVHAFAWGSVRDGTRLVLSVFQASDAAQPEPAAESSG
jgi:Zn-dependent peptidase ImmA (M78 family)